MARKYKYMIGFIAQLIVVALITVFTEYDVRDLYYVLTKERINVQYKQQVDSIMGDFKVIPFDQLPKSYQQQSGSLEPKYHKTLKKLNFYQITRKDLYRNITGDFHIKHYVCKADMKGGYSQPIYWLIDKKILYKTLELQDSLRSKGYDPHGFSISNGHRHPHYNDQIGGASKSQHLWGKAIDIKIKDINKDGKSNQADKKIVLDLLENHIIKRRGGVGRYVGTMSIHYDVRGHYARWDSFKRK